MGIEKATEQTKYIRVTCDVKDFLPYEQITPLQGRLKKRTPEQLEKICRSVIKHGWAFPEFIWKNEDKNYCLDGHGRQEAIPMLIENGYIIPEIPVVYIQAKNRDEAKELLLKCISQYGTVTQEGIGEFIDFNVDFIDFEIPNISFDNMKLGGSDDVEDANLEESDFNYKEQFGVIVICDSEAQQEAVYTKLAGEGFNVRVVKT
jgi:hypothetical protein